MSINLNYAMNRDLTKKRFGPLLHTIDFRKNEAFSKDNYIFHTSSHKKRKCGTFFIGNHEISVSMLDLKQIKNELLITFESLRRNRPKKRLDETEVKVLRRTMYLTKYEIEHVINTVENALDNIEKDYSMGMLTG